MQTTACLEASRTVTISCLDQAQASRACDKRASPVAVFATVFDAMSHQEDNHVHSLRQARIPSEFACLNAEEAMVCIRERTYCRAGTRPCVDGHGAQAQHAQPWLGGGVRSGFSPEQLASAHPFQQLGWCSAMLSAVAFRRSLRSLQSGRIG